VFENSILTCSDPKKIGTGLSETQSRIWSASYIVGIVVILSVIFPETHGAYVVASAFRQCSVAAAEARILLIGAWLEDIFETGIAFEPAFAIFLRVAHVRLLTLISDL
jgi:hypothetical protein